MTYDGSSESKEELTKMVKNANPEDIYMILEFISFQVKQGNIDREYLKYWMGYLRDKEISNAIIQLVDYDKRND